MEPQPDEWKKAAAEIKQTLTDRGILPAEDVPVKKVATVAKSAPALKLAITERLAKAEEPIVERSEPIWPVELDVWKAEVEKIKLWAKEKKEEVITPERKAELHGWARQSVERWWASRSRTRVEKKEEPVAKVKAIKPEGRQKRLGQTKLIDDLLKAGKSEAEITEEVKKQIPSYPIERIPKMIKLRQYHVKKK